MQTSTSTMLSDMASSTPSPTASANQGTTSSASRRPPRKSTLTQQQKNQKRQRATQDQLALLEVEFNKNPTPTAIVRERIAQEINMTERSVQIWFQNRRAKIKLLTKKSIETGEDCDAIPESYRNYLAHQAAESGKPLARTFLGAAGGPMAPYGHGATFLGAENPNPQKVVIHHFLCKSLSIGTWRRVGQNAMDLVVFYSVGDKPCLTYYINNDAAGYKIEFPFSYIKNITLENGLSVGGSSRPPGLLLELNRPPNFFMDSSGSGGFYQCGDFTEAQQASSVMVHHLGGDASILSSQLAHLITLESFKNRHIPEAQLQQNRHNAESFHRQNPFLDTSAIAVSAPVSPVGNRPSSQPNAMSHPHMGLFQEQGFGMSLHPHARGHKRTRSRSVPAIIDFSMLHQPMPSFHVQHPSTTFTDPSIFAPVPQHHSNLTPGGNNLRINTANGFDLDFRQYPMSAATTSPSEYASPSFLSSGVHMDSMPASSYNSSYGVPFLSPMPEHPHMLQQSVSPLSAMGHGDPVIADQSPPMSNMPRSPSADLFSMSHDHQSNMGDEGLMLSEMYSKQSLNLPIRSPGMDDTNLEMHLHEDPSNDDMDMQHMLQFGTIDPSNLAAENLGM